ncbi:YceD family protein [Desulfovibrio litoralis]|uniref:DUF177 domain-containing protein n=1 Tax=Desulfovibrio litoralis DSM 11393 TaxID=1121455 RepID=A0A1M7SCS7_9BACT|nr:DUF177 domain-containing protein [Desulfovibrio litoralis]SHN56296.1 uncharacterized protein SAMN02745728_00773 [Desulfovibrio litoralis DSM 11393]
MCQLWIDVNAIPAEGKQFEISEEKYFTDFIDKYNLDCQITSPLKAIFFVLPQAEGCFVRGQINGEFVLPCNRCTEDTKVTVSHSFESFEPFPPELSFDTPLNKHILKSNQTTKQATKEEQDFDLDSDSEVLRYNQKLKSFEINLFALAWEEFVLSLPVKPLCNTRCKGLCSECGQNLNEATCECKSEIQDPRLAALQNLHLNKKS